MENIYQYLEHTPNVSGTAMELSKELKTFWGLIEDLHRRVIPTEMRDKLMADGIHSTLAIEGNLLSSEKVLNIMLGKDRPDMYKSEDYQEAQNIIHALSVIRHTEGVNILPVYLNRLHRIVLSHLRVAPHVRVGHLRVVDVRVGSYVAPPSKSVGLYINGFCRWVRRPASNGAESILKAIAAHAWIACIHPYGDGNGRMSRLIELKLLMESGVPEIFSHLFAKHCWDTQQMYYEKINTTHTKAGSDIIGGIYLLDFAKYMIDGVNDKLQNCLDTVEWRR